MKKNMILFSLIGLVIIVNAQSIDMGLKGGLNFSKLSNNNINYSGTNSATGYVVGAYGRVGLLGFFVQPELLFSQRKGAFTSKVDQTAVVNTLSYIDVPILFGYKLLAARLNFGPNFQFLVAANQKATAAARDQNFSKDNFNSSVVGYQAGIGVDLSKLSLDLRYDGSFGNLGKEIITSSGQKVNYATRATMWQLTLGFKLF